MSGIVDQQRPNGKLRELRGLIFRLRFFFALPCERKTPPFCATFNHLRARGANRFRLKGMTPLVTYLEPHSLLCLSIKRKCPFSLFATSKNGSICPGQRCIDLGIPSMPETALHLIRSHDLSLTRLFFRQSDLTYVPGLVSLLILAKCAYLCKGQ